MRKYNVTLNISIEPNPDLNAPNTKSKPAIKRMLESKIDEAISVIPDGFAWNILENTFSMGIYDDDSFQGK